MFEAPSGQSNVFWIAGVTLALLNFRAEFSSDGHFQQFPLCSRWLLLLEVFCTYKVQGAPLVYLSLILVCGFFLLLWEKSREGWRFGGMLWPVVNEHSGPALDYKKGRVRRAGWWAGGLSHRYAVRKGGVMILLWLMLEEAFRVRSFLCFK